MLHLPVTEGVGIVFGRIWGLLFKKEVKAEHITFGEYNEYLIVSLVEHFLFWVIGKEETVIRSIGNTRSQVIRDLLHWLEEEKVEIRNRNLTWEEFLPFALSHPVLQDDEWVEIRKLALETGTARR